MIVQNGYIIAVEAQDVEREVVLERLNSKPTDPDGYRYLLNANTFEWELVEIPPVPDPEPDDHDKAEAYDIIMGVSE